MGILDYLNDDGAKQGLAILAAAGPSATPLSLWQRLAQAQGTYDAGKDADLMRQYRKAQIGNVQSETAARGPAMEKAQLLNALLKQLQGRTAGAGGQGAASAAPATPGMPGLAGAVMGGGGAPPAGGAIGARDATVAGLSVDDVGLLHAAGGPNLLDILKFKTNPIKMEGGSTYVNPTTGAREYMPKLPEGFAPDGGGGFGPAPGIVPGVGAMAGATAQAQEAAKAGGDLVNVKMQDGTTRQMSRAQALQMSGAGQPPAPAVPPLTGALAPRSSPPPVVAPGAGAGTGTVSRDEYARANAVQAGASGDLASQINARVGELQKATDPTVKAGLQREIARLGGLLQPEGGNGAPQAQPAPASPGMAVLSPGQEAFLNAAAKSGVDKLEDSEKKASGAADTLNTIAESRKAIASGAFQGAGADFKLNTGKWLQTMGLGNLVLDPNKVSNSDYLKSTLGAALLANGKALGTQATENDARRIEEIVGTIGKDPRAMDRVLDWQEDLARRSISDHNRRVDDVEKRNGQLPMNRRVDVPEPRPGAAPGAAAATPQPTVDALNQQNAAQFKGKIARDPATGQRFRSNGVQWTKVE